MLKKEKEDLINNLKKKKYIKSKIVTDAFLKVPREKFVPKNIIKKAYFDSPLRIGNNQTISAPHMVAIMCEELDLKLGQKVLEIGTGSGYHAAIVSKIVGSNGKIFSIERHKNLADKARDNLKKAGIKNIEVWLGDGSEGLKKYQPYDRIYVTCAAPDIPKPLIEQLKNPGILLIPVGNNFCELKKIEKKNEKISTKNLGGCAFVPLIGKYGHSI